MSAEQEIPVDVAGIAFDPKKKSPVVILRDAAAERVLPIWVGSFEANAIIAEKEHVKSPRPMTHDLLKRVVLTLGAAVDRVVITEIRDNTFFAELHLVYGEDEILVDCRPSDGIALALRFNAPIFVAESVLAFEESKQQSAILNSEDLSRFLDGLTPDDFEKR